MKVTKDLLFEEAVNAGIPQEQIDELWDGLSAACARQRKYDPLHVAYYFGAFIIVAAVTYFFTMAWDRVGGGAILAIALTYAGIFGALGHHLYRARSLHVAGGLLTGVAICMMPVAAYGLANALGWPARYEEFVMEFASVAASLIALRFLRLPFLMTPAAIALWYLAIEAVPASQQCWASVGYGIALMAAGFRVDKRTQLDYAFWLYLFGVAAFWGGLSFMDSGGPWSRLWYFVVSALLIVVSTLLDRRVFAIFGCLGVGGYLSYLMFRLFRGSLFLPMALTLTGVGMIMATVAYQRNRGRIDPFLAGLLPGELTGLFQRGRQTAR